MSSTCVENNYGSFYGIPNDIISITTSSDSLIDRIVSLIPFGKNVIDVGANIGVHTVAYSKATTGTIYSFEPQIEINNVLQANISLNKLTNVMVYHAAISNQSGFVTLRNRYEYGGEEIVLNSKEKSNFGGIGIGHGDEIVEMKSLDSLNLKNIGLIKIDGEAAEPLVFMGAKKLIEDQRPLIVFKHFDNTGVFAKFWNEISTLLNLSDAEKNFDMFAYLHNIGYKVEPITSNSYLATPLAPIVSLTTIPSRLLNIHQTLNSLKRQTLLPSKIILVIPFKCSRFKDPYVIPDYLNKDNYPLVEILRCEDIGPASKIIPIIDLGYEGPIIFLDDDRTYKPDLVESLYAASLEHPDDVISSIGMERGHTQPIFSGCCGVLVKKKMFTSDVVPIPEEFKYVDDFWLSGHIAKNGVKIFCLGADDQPRNFNNCVDDLVGLRFNGLGRAQMDQDCMQYYRKNYNVKLPF